MPPVYRSLDEKKELEAKNGALQFLQVVSEIEDWKPGTSQISPKLLLSLQHRAIVNIYSCAGSFRTGRVFIKDGDMIVHEPPPWQEVEGFMYYNFIKIHGTLRVTPAMAAGVTDRLWEMSDVVRLVEEKEVADAKVKREAKASRDSSYGSAPKGNSRYY